MSTRRRRIIIWSLIMALALLIWGAASITDSTMHEHHVHPEITASPTVTLPNPTPKITITPAPVPTTEPSQVSIPAQPEMSTVQQWVPARTCTTAYQPPYTAPPAAYRTGSCPITATGSNGACRRDFGYCKEPCSNTFENRC